MAIGKELLDQLLAGRDPQELFAKDGLINELKQALSERMLAVELDDHLESKPDQGEGIEQRRATGGEKGGMVCVDLEGAVFCTNKNKQQQNNCIKNINGR